MENKVNPLGRLLKTILADVSWVGFVLVKLPLARKTVVAGCNFSPMTYV